MRVRNWDVALAEWASAQIGKPFVWGETDCVSLVFAGLEVVLGHPFYPKPVYTSEEEARQLIPFDGRMGQQFAILAPAVPENMEQTADVIVLPADEAAGEFCDGLGIVVGSSLVLVTNPEQGVRVVKLEAVRRVTKIQVFRPADT